MSLLSCSQKSLRNLPPSYDQARNLFCGAPWNAEEKADMRQRLVVAKGLRDPAPGLIKASDMYNRCWKIWKEEDDNL